MHINEIEITVPLVRRLLQAQFSQWAELSIQPVKSDGTSHVIYRLGDEMCIRLPRVAQSERQILTEQQWLPFLAPHLPLRTPKPLALGKPSLEYSLHWAVYRWLEGENAAVASVADLCLAATELASFIKALQLISIEGAPASQRGLSLKTQDKEMHEAIKSLYGVVDTKAVTALWEDALLAPEWDKPPVWLHGDLLPANILVMNDRINAVIDFGLAGIGDPACDLLPAWSLFSHDSREQFRVQLAVDDATWRRGRGWALFIAVIIIPYYQHTNPGITAVAYRMLKEILQSQSDLLY